MNDSAALSNVTRARWWPMTDGTLSAPISTTFHINYSSSTNTFTIEFDHSTTPVLDLEELIKFYDTINLEVSPQLENFLFTIGMTELQQIAKDPNDAVFLFSLSELGLGPTSFLVDISKELQQTQSRLDSAPGYARGLDSNWSCILNTHVSEKFESIFLSPLDGRVEGSSSGVISEI